jgi:hypothetical protein
MILTGVEGLEKAQKRAQAEQFGFRANPPPGQRDQ